MKSIRLKRLPFNIELAKKITDGEIEGKITTRDGRSARIICWDAKNDNSIIALINDDGEECIESYPSDGLIFLQGESNIDLFVEIVD